MAYTDGMKFSTWDRDNDKYTSNCAQRYKGGWWFKWCHNANLHGMYYTDQKDVPSGGMYGIIWYHWLGNSNSLKSSTMMIRSRKS